MKSVQKLAMTVFQKVEDGQSLNIVLNEIYPGGQIALSDRAALQDIAYGCQRYKLTLKFWLSQLVFSEISEKQINYLLYIALYQLAYTRNAEYAVVNNAVNEAEQIARGKFKRLVNGVLRNFIRQKEALKKLADEDKSVCANHPPWWVERLKKEHPDEWESILKAGNNHPFMTLRVNLSRITIDDYVKLLAEAGIEGRVLGAAAVCLVKPAPVKKIPGFADGLVSVQDWGAQYAADLLDLRPGQYVLDACAAPGGKTCHILEKENVQLMAVDIDSVRLGLVNQNLQRLHLSAKMHAADLKNLKEWWDCKRFDRILADVPCSASGVVRRHPDIKWLRQPQDIRKFASQQSILLETLWTLLAELGKMLYATCSVFQEENQQQIDTFLHKHANAVLLQDKQLLPNEDHDGFYYALLEKHS